MCVFAVQQYACTLHESGIVVVYVSVLFGVCITYASGMVCV